VRSTLTRKAAASCQITAGIVFEEVWTLGHTCLLTLCLHSDITSDLTVAGLHAALVVCRHVSEAQSVPLQQLDSSIADEWRSKTVVVTGSGDTRSQQACTRLSKVYKLSSVFHLIADVV